MTGQRLSALDETILIDAIAQRKANQVWERRDDLVLIDTSSCTDGFIWAARDYLTPQTVVRRFNQVSVRGLIYGEFVCKVSGWLILVLLISLLFCVYWQRWCWATIAGMCIGGLAQVIYRTSAREFLDVSFNLLWDADHRFWSGVLG